MSHSNSAKCRSLAIALIGSELLGMTALAGCRALASRRPDKHVVQARQLSRQGVDLLSHSEFEAAEEHFTEAIQQCPSDERAHWGISQTLWQSGNKSQALEHMQEAVRLSAQNPDYMVRLGEMYLELGDVPHARQIANQIIEHHRDNATAWAVLGNTLVYDREWDAALQAYHRSLLIQPDNPPVQLAVAEIYRQLGRPHRSLATLDRLADHHPTELISGEVQLAKGLALLEMGRTSEAQLAFSNASERLAADDVPRHLQLAAAQQKLGNFAEARSTLASVLQNYPEDPSALRLQAMLDLSYEHLAKAPLADGNFEVPPSFVR